jgi:hypothetical protein
VEHELSVITAVEVARLQSCERVSEVDHVLQPTNYSAAATRIANQWHVATSSSGRRTAQETARQHETACTARQRGKADHPVCRIPAAGAELVITSGARTHAQDRRWPQADRPVSGQTDGCENVRRPLFPFSQA